MDNEPLLGERRPKVFVTVIYPWKYRPRSETEEVTMTQTLINSSDSERSAPTSSRTTGPPTAVSSSAIDLHPYTACLDGSSTKVTEHQPNQVAPVTDRTLRGFKSDSQQRLIPEQSVGDQSLGSQPWYLSGEKPPPYACYIGYRCCKDDPPKPDKTHKWHTMIFGSARQRKILVRAQKADGTIDISHHTEDCPLAQAHLSLLSDMAVKTVDENIPNRRHTSWMFMLAIWLVGLLALPFGVTALVLWLLSKHDLESGKIRNYRRKQRTIRIIMIIACVLVVAAAIFTFLFGVISVPRSIQYEHTVNGNQPSKPSFDMAREFSNKMLRKSFNEIGLRNKTHIKSLQSGKQFGPLA